MFRSLINTFKNEFFEYPLKTKNKNLGLYIKLLQKQWREPNNSIKQYNVYENIHANELEDGYHLIFHDPFEMPWGSSSHFQTALYRSLSYFITPELTEIDDSLIEYSPKEWV